MPRCSAPRRCRMASWARRRRRRSVSSLNVPPHCRCSASGSARYSDHKHVCDHRQWPFLHSGLEICRCGPARLGGLSGARGELLLVLADREAEQSHEDGEVSADEDDGPDDRFSHHLSPPSASLVPPAGGGPPVPSSGAGPSVSSSGDAPPAPSVIGPATTFLARKRLRASMTMMPRLISWNGFHHCSVPVTAPTMNQPERATNSSGKIRMQKIQARPKWRSATASIMALALCTPNFHIAIATPRPLSSSPFPQTL